MVSNEPMVDGRFNAAVDGAAATGFSAGAVLVVPVFSVGVGVAGGGGAGAAEAGEGEGAADRGERPSERQAGDL